MVKRKIHKNPDVDNAWVRLATKFQELAELRDPLEVTSSHISMVNLVADFLNALEVDEVEPTVRMVRASLSELGSKKA